jgi:hypothetical protein
MSEPIGMSIRIGGQLPAGLIEEFLSEINDEIYDICNGPTTEQKLYRESKNQSQALQWVGQANYGECSGVKTFCREHNLSYIHHCEAKYEYNAAISFWVPGMKSEQDLASSQDCDPVISITTIKPYVDLLLEYATLGDAAFPLFIGNESMGDLIEKCLKHPKKALELIKGRLRKLLPVEPTLPPLTIKE